MLKFLEKLLGVAKPAKQVKWKAQTHSDLKRHEGLVLKAYKDTVGVWTIGYGHTGGVKPGDVITQEEADRLLAEDMEIAIRDAKVVLGEEAFNSLDWVRKTVIVNMAFNLGFHKLSEFHRTLNAIRTGDYKSAALFMLESRWASQVGQRARELASRMSTGKL